MWGYTADVASMQTLMNKYKQIISGNLTRALM